jgi:hypothetical protein
MHGARGANFRELAAARAQIGDGAPEHSRTSQLALFTAASRSRDAASRRHRGAHLTLLTMPRRTRRSAIATCHVTNLSDELVVEILSQLSRTPFPALGIARAACVCKAWRNLVKANEERLWKEVALMEHGIESLEGGALEAMGFRLAPAVHGPRYSLDARHAVSADE